MYILHCVVRHLFKRYSVLPHEYTNTFYLRFFFFCNKLEPETVKTKANKISITIIVNAYSNSNVPRRPDSIISLGQMTIDSNYHKR